VGNLNKVMIIGNVGKDPEMRYTPSGKPVTSFTVAVNSFSGTGEERKKDTEWFNVVAWDRLAETANQYLTKGKSVYVEGRFKTRSWDGQDGQKHYRTELIANTMQFLDKQAAAALPESAGPADEVEPDDLPL